MTRPLLSLPLLYQPIPVSLNSQLMQTVIVIKMVLRWVEAGVLMGLGILGLFVLLSAILAQMLLFPVSVVDSFHLPIPLWFGHLSGWVGLGILLVVGAWLLGDR
ncbi:MAG: hypothetical protein NW224_15765 [Leptolyngbyaceae cyanobacterium bins.302]|nr:hypothetical protein [Leptolyngbyaceae cyanobacterium bins.302]